MTFRAFDIGTFLVTSRTREGHHLLSLLGDGKALGDAADPIGCSCEGYLTTSPFNTCEHYREALRRRQRGTLRIIVGMKGKQ